MEKNYYQILGIGNKASIEEINAAYRRLAMKYHPDINKNDTTALLQSINEAYEVLSDPKKRADYDPTFSQYTNQRDSNPYKQQYQSEKTREWKAKWDSFRAERQQYKEKQQSEKKEEKYDYEFPADKYSNRIVHIMSKLSSYSQISEIIAEINPIMQNIREKWDAKDYLKISSTIALKLMNIVIHDLNQMAQNLNNNEKVNYKDLVLAFEILKQIDENLEMDKETARVHSKNKDDMAAFLNNYYKDTANQKASLITLALAIPLFWLVFSEFDMSFSFRMLFYALGVLAILHRIIRFFIWVLSPYEYFE
jgi:hypothetical protein